MQEIPQSVTLRVPLKAYLTSDHVSDATGKTLAVVISKNGGAFGNPSAGATNATEIGSGWYYVDLSTTDTGTKGPIMIRATVALVDNVEVLYQVVDAHNAGYDALPSATAGTSGGTPLSVDSSGRVDVLKINGTSQTARDIGASVLLSTGTGTGQLDFTSGVVKANLAQILGTALTETAGLIAAAFKQFFNVATPTGTVNLLPRVTLTDTVTTYTGNTPQTGDNFARIGVAGAGLTALGDTRIANLDAAVSSRNATTPPTVAAIRSEMDSNSTKLANLDAAISSRGTSTYAGGAVASVTAGVTVTTNNDKTGYSLTVTPPTAATIATTLVDQTLSGHTTSGTVGGALNTAAAGTDPWSVALPGAYSAGSAGKIVGDNVDATISSRTKPADTQAAVTLVATTTNLTNAPTSGDLTATMKTSVTTAATAATPTISPDPNVALIKAKTDNLPGDPADASDIAGAFSTVNSTLATIGGYIDTEVAAIKAKTDLIPASPAAVGDIPTAAQTADKILGRNLAGGSDGGRTVTDALRFSRNKVVISGTTITVYAEDDVTPAWVGTLTTDATAAPITAMDPA